MDYASRVTSHESSHTPASVSALAWVSRQNRSVRSLRRAGQRAVQEERVAEPEPYPDVPGLAMAHRAGAAHIRAADHGNADQPDRGLAEQAPPRRRDALR